MKNKSKLENLNFKKFSELAAEKGLSKYEKIGFYDHLRKGIEADIFEDIRSKLSNLGKKNQVVVDIGCGCSDLPLLLIELCRKHKHQLVLIDSKEMLDNLPDAKFITKIAGQYPNECGAFLKKYKGKADVVLSYSVFHYVFEELPYMGFIDSTLSLLSNGGQFLLGDLPNNTKKNRFFNSEAGIRYHQKNNKTKEKPVLNFNEIPQGIIDDGVIFGILQRARNSGFESYLVPQNEALAMSNRRDDILIVKH
jgi:hypothetical protein